MNGGDITRTTFLPLRHFSSVRMQQGRVQLDADWNEQVDIERYRGQTEVIDAVGPAGIPKDIGGFELSLAPDGSDLLISSGRAWIGGTLCELEATSTGVAAVNAAELTLSTIVLDGAELRPHDWVALIGDSGNSIARLTAVDTQNRVVTVDPAPDAAALGDHLRLSRRASYARQPDLPAPDFVAQLEGGSPPAVQLPAGSYLAYLDVWQRPITALEAPGLKETALGGPDTTTRSRTVWQVKLLGLTDAPAGLTCDSDLSAWTSALAEPTGTMAARAEPDASTQNLCTPTAAGGFAGLENQLYRVQVHDLTEDGRPVIVWSRDNGSVVTSWLGDGATPGQLTVADVGKDSVLGFGAGQWVELTDDAHELSGRPGTLIHLLDAQGTTLFFATTGADAPTGTTTFADFGGSPKARRWDSAGGVDITFDSWTALEDGVQVFFPAGGTYRGGDYWLIPARTAIGDVEWPRDSAGTPSAEPPNGVAHSWGRLALVFAPAEGPPTLLDCRDIFPSLTTLTADDVAYVGTTCVIPGAATVQDALDELCKEHDLRRHHKLLHGWGIVNGLQVRCGGDTQVEVLPGTAIDCEGNDLDLDDLRPVPLLDLVTQAVPEAIDANGNGDVCLLLKSDAELQVGFGVEKYDPSQDEPPAMLEGTLWSDFWRDCIKTLQDWLKQELTADDGQGHVGKGRRLVTALTNLIAQPVNPKSGQNIFISPSEDKILQSFYQGLRERLQSDTFCAMFDNARRPPDYPQTFPPRMDVVFGIGSHNRLRMRPSATEAYTVGPGANPIKPITVIHRYDLQNGILLNRIDPIAGRELGPDESPVPGNGPVTDVAFSPDGKQIFAAIPTSNEDNTIFRVGDVAATTVSWRPPVTICGVKLVTLATTTADPKIVYAIGLKKVTVNNKVQWQGAGLYRINPDSIDPNMSPMPFPADFNPVGHLVVLPDGRAAATSAPPGQAVTSYSSVFRFTLPNPPAAGTQIQLPSSGADDITLVPFANGTVRVFVVLSLNGRSIIGYDLGSGAPVTPAPVQLQTVNSAVRLLTVGGNVAATSSDEYLMRLVTSADGQLVGSFQIPMQVGPISMAQSAPTKRVYVLNYVSNTLESLGLEAFSPKQTFPFPDLAAYRSGMLEAFADLLGGFLQYLKDCLFDHFLVNPPVCTGNEKLYLAVISIRGNKVYRVCNFSRRRYVKSFPLVGYWLSVVPLMPYLKQWFTKFACTVLPEYFSKLSVNDGSSTNDRLSVEMIQQLLAWSQSSNVTGRFREVRQKTSLTQNAAGLALRSIQPQPQPAGGVTLLSSDLIGKTESSAAEAATAKGLTVQTQPFQPTVGAAAVRDVAGLFRTAQPGDHVTLFTDDTGQVRFFDIAKPSAPAAEVLRAAPPQTLAETTDAQAQLATLQGRLAQADTDIADLRRQISTLSDAHEQLRTQVTGGDQPQ